MSSNFMAIGLHDVESVPVVKPLAIDLFCGLGGWTEGLLAEGYYVVGFDIERHEYGDEKYPAQLVLQDVLTIHGSQFKDAALIVASPPCQEFSYMAMPWTRAKEKAAALRDGRDDPKRLTALFDACFRIQREANEANRCAPNGFCMDCQGTGNFYGRDEDGDYLPCDTCNESGRRRHIPLVVENVRGAIPWVGRSRWNFGSFHLWGDVPALMPMIKRTGFKAPGQQWNVNRPNFTGTQGWDDSRKNSGGSWFAIGSPGQKETGRNPVHGLISAERERETDGCKLGGSWFHEYRKGQGPRNHGSKSKACKRASAMIAKIPITLSRHIASVYWPASSSTDPARHGSTTGCAGIPAAANHARLQAP